MKKQPAFENYFYKDVYHDLKNCCKKQFSYIIKIILLYFYDLKRSLRAGRILTLIGYLPITLVKMIFTAIISTAFFLVYIIIQFFIVLLCLVFLYLLSLIVKFFDWLFRSIKGITTSCPNCQDRFSLPHYVCECGAIHTSLTPSRYGVFKRKCQCGKQLKTTIFNGRSKQSGKWVCKMCGYELNDPNQVDVTLPVIGGPSSGKTCFISMSIMEIEEIASQKNMYFSYKANLELGDDFDENKKSMLAGRLPQKTSDGRLKYYQFYLNKKNSKIKNLISICDVAGETFESYDEIGKQRGFINAKAYIMIVDPLSILQFRDSISKSSFITNSMASKKNIDEVIDILVKTIENMKSGVKKIKKELIVVFSKTDIPELDNLFSDKVIFEYMTHNKIKNYYQAVNDISYDFLLKYSENNFVNILKTRFKTVQFFFTSALGHVENGCNFNPRDVETPILWILSRKLKKLKFNDLLNKKITNS